MSTMHAPSRLGSLADLPRVITPIRKEQPAPARRMATPSDMMYAWSMGAAAARTSFKARVRDDRCPPEVYLG